MEQSQRHAGDPIGVGQGRDLAQQGLCHMGVLMVAEKFDAAAEASLAAARSFALGEPHHAAGRAVAVYREKVDRNYRRLTGA